jgi:hypothetical protein
VDVGQSKLLKFRLFFLDMQRQQSSWIESEKPNDMKCNFVEKSKGSEPFTKNKLK